MKQPMGVQNIVNNPLWIGMWIGHPMEDNNLTMLILPSDVELTCHFKGEY